MPEIVVYPATPFVNCGVVQPLGTVNVIEPLFMVSVAVNVKVYVPPVEPAVVVNGVTVFVPEPSAANSGRQFTELLLEKHRALRPS